MRIRQETRLSVCPSSPARRNRPFPISHMERGRLRAGPGRQESRGPPHARTARATSVAVSPRSGPGRSLVSARRVPRCARCGLLAQSGREDGARGPEHRLRSRSCRSLPPQRCRPRFSGEAPSSVCGSGDAGPRAVPGVVAEPERRAVAPRTVAFSKTSAIRTEHPAGVPDKPGEHGARTGPGRETGNFRTLWFPNGCLLPGSPSCRNKADRRETGSEDRVAGTLCSRTNTCTETRAFEPFTT